MFTARTEHVSAKFSLSFSDKILTSLVRRYLKKDESALSNYERSP